MVSVMTLVMGYSIGKPVAKIYKYSIIFATNDKNDPRVVGFLAALLHYVVRIYVDMVNYNNLQIPCMYFRE